MRNANYVIALVAAMIALVFFIGSFFFNQAVLSDTQVGAAFFPRMLSILLFSLSVLLVWSTWRRGACVSEKGFSPLFGKTATVPFIACILIVIYLFLLEPAGFLVSTFLINAAFLMLFRVRNPLGIILVPLIFTVVTYVVFSKLLMVPLPEGVFYF